MLLQILKLGCNKFYKVLSKNNVTFILLVWNKK